MRVPINMGVKGKVTATLTNIKTGEKQEVKGDNLILNHYMDRAMERGLGVLGPVTFDRCYIGTGDTPPQPGDTTFNGTQLAMSAVSELVKDVGPNPRIEQVNLIQEIGVTNINGLAVTPDENILIVAAPGDTSDLPGLRAFLIDKTSWTLTPLQVDAFEELENLDCRALSTGGEYLFVGLNSAPWGKLFRRNGNNFEFVANVPGLSYTIQDSDISSGGNYLIVLSGTSTNRVVLYEIIDNSISELFTTSTNYANAVGISPSGERYFIASGRGRDGTSGGDGYLRIYKWEGQTYSLEFTYAQIGSYGIVASAAFVSDNSLVLLDGYGSTTNYTLRWLDYNMDTGNWDVTLSASRGVSNDKVDYFVEKYILLSGSRAIWIPPSDIAHKNTDESSSLSASTALLNNAGVFFARLQGDERSHIGVYQIRTNIQNTQSYARQWTFPAGVGTGIVNLVGLQANSSTTGDGGSNRHVAQIFLPESLEKTDLHQLDVIWEIEVENPGVWEGVIPGGSRDGSDLAWRVTINEEQFLALVLTGYNILANWFGITGTPNVRIGTSNEESDLIFDGSNIRGEEIEYISSTALRVVNPYVPGSLKRTIRVFLEVNQGIGQIGEIVLGGSQSVNSLVRITFDPPLDKPPDVGPGADPYRIYFDLEIGWQRGE